MRHLDLLDQRFGADHVLGGLCIISSGLEPGGGVVHFNNLDILIFGERDGALSARVEEIAQVFSSGRFASLPSKQILLEMWEKWVFIAACAGITCLMRANIGDIVAAGAADLSLALFDECAAIAASHGNPPRPDAIQQSRAMLTKSDSGLTASMFRDIERNAPTEAAHMIGDLLCRGEDRAIPSPLLRVAYAHLKAYEVRRAREAATQD
jgi:2-dehydropantoate 2-reductase